MLTDMRLDQFVHERIYSSTDRDRLMKRDGAILVCQDGRSTPANCPMIRWIRLISASDYFERCAIG